jgi:hypothetical protein
MLGNMIYLSSDWKQTIGRERGCSRNTLVKECLTLLARHGSVCIRKHETNSFQVSGRENIVFKFSAHTSKKIALS